MTSSSSSQSEKSSLLMLLLLVTLRLRVNCKEIPKLIICFSPFSPCTHFNFPQFLLARFALDKDEIYTYFLFKTLARSTIEHCRDGKNEICRFFSARFYIFCWTMFLSFKQFLLQIWHMEVIKKNSS